jgi:hypothetical protein
MIPAEYSLNTNSNKVAVFLGTIFATAFQTANLVTIYSCELVVTMYLQLFSYIVLTNSSSYKELCKDLTAVFLRHFYRYRTFGSGYEKLDVWRLTFLFQCRSFGRPTRPASMDCRHSMPPPPAASLLPRLAATASHHDPLPRPATTTRRQPASAAGACPTLPVDHIGRILSYSAAQVRSQWIYEFFSYKEGYSL